MTNFASTQQQSDVDPQNNMIVMVVTNSRYFKKHHGGSSEGITSAAASGVDSDFETGMDIRELAYVWHFLCEHGLDKRIILASPHGGESPIDPMARKEAEKDELVREFMKKEEVKKKLSQTVKIEDLLRRGGGGHDNSDLVQGEQEQIGMLRRCCALILIGGHGALADFPESKPLSQLVTMAWKYANKATIAAIGEGVIGLLNAKDERGQPLVRGRKITCTTKQEEEQLNLVDRLPFIVEERLRQAGAEIEMQKAFQPNVVVSDNGRLITAQNFRSARPFAEKVYKAMEGHRLPN